MDEHFDQLSRTMAGALPRRRALKLIAGTVAGMGAAVLGLRPLMVDAACSGMCSSSGVCSAYCCTTSTMRRTACGGRTAGACHC